MGLWSERVLKKTNMERNGRWKGNYTFVSSIAAVFFGFWLITRADNDKTRVYKLTKYSPCWADDDKNLQGTSPSNRSPIREWMNNLTVRLKYILIIQWSAIIESDKMRNNDNRDNISVSLLFFYDQCLASARVGCFKWWVGHNKSCEGVIAGI